MLTCRGGARLSAGRQANIDVEAYVLNGDSVLPQQAAVIAVRREGETVQICLIRDTKAKSWGVPKGLVDRGWTQQNTALNEAWEEAGLKGKIVGEALGAYQYQKWGITFAVTVYLMEVLEQHEDWQEAGFRERRWTSFTEAASLLRHHPIRPLLDRATGFLADAVT